MNYVKIFHSPFLADALRRFRFCSYCGRERGRRETCDGCGAPSIHVPAQPLYVVDRPAVSVLDDDFVFEPNALIRTRRVDDLRVCYYEGVRGFDPEAEGIRMARAGGATSGPGWFVVET